MSTTVIVRGNVAKFTSTFTDDTGAAVVPASANLYVSYIGANGYLSSGAITMDAGTDDYTATWDTSIGRAGITFWHIRAASPPAAEDGSFELAANAANPSP